MIALDTNVMVRFLVCDELEQARIATETLESLNVAEPVFVSREVLVELVWVLDRAYYDCTRPEIADALNGLLTLIEILVETNEDVAPALRHNRSSGFEFAGLMPAAAAKRAGGSKLVTFDRKVARLPDAYPLSV